MGKILTSEVILDDFTKEITKCFDWEFNGLNTFECWDKPDVPEEFNIGLIVGASGTGKSTLLNEFGTIKEVKWDNSKCIASNFATPQEATDRLCAVGLNSIPTWTKPFNVLSNGEAFRANLARRLENNAVVDEFTSVVDRNVAKSCSVSIQKYIRKNNLHNIVFASCHRDIIEYLEPDWVFDTDTGELSVGRIVRCNRPVLSIYKCTKDLWPMFEKYHYLNNTLNNACRCYVGVWNNQIVAFSASLYLPGKIPPLYEGDTRGKFRESRLVILPDYQGMGFGTRMSNAVGQMFLDEGYRYFSKTAHIRMGEYRQHSDLWRPTATNLKSREKSQKCSKKEAWHHMLLDVKRVCYSHEYVGPIGYTHRDLWEEEKRKRLDKCEKS